MIQQLKGRVSGEPGLRDEPPPGADRAQGGKLAVKRLGAQRGIKTLDIGGEPGLRGEPPAASAEASLGGTGP